MPLDARNVPDAARFETERGRLTGLAYRLLGTLSDAEDAVQDAWLRWRRVDAATVDNPRAFLSAVVTRLCLDRLRQARRRREVYVGPWLPEPLLSDPAEFDASEQAFAADVSFALMLALERLSPLERAAFILHDAFEMSFGEIATILGRTEAACRQLARRARDNVRAGRPRFTPTAKQRGAVAEAFFAASRSGDAAALGRLLAQDATLHTDGGGRKRAALRVIAGAAKIGRLYAGLARKAIAPTPLWSRPATINGMPGLLTVEPDHTRQATAVEIRGGLVCGIYVIRNPDKLERLWARLEPGGVI